MATSAFFDTAPNTPQIQPIDIQAEDWQHFSAIANFNIFISGEPQLVAPLPNFAATVGTKFKFVVPEHTFQNIGIQDIMTYSAALTTGMVLPAWLTFDPATNTFTGTPSRKDTDAFNSRPLPIRLMASNKIDTASVDFIINVQGESDATLAIKIISAMSAALFCSFLIKEKLMVSPVLMEINLHDRSSFQWRTISKDQAKARWRLLGIEQTKLKKLVPPQDLSPSSLKEKKLLGKAMIDKNPSHTIRIVLDDAGLFYDIQMRENITLKKWHQLNSQTNSIVGICSSKKKILMAMVKPDDNLRWYQIAIRKHIKGVYRSDFLDSLELSHLTNLNLMSAARHLQLDPKVGPQLISLYFEAYNLYQEHLDFNRACEGQMLESARGTAEAIFYLHKLVGNCGEKGDTMPENFLEECKLIVESEIAQNLTFTESIVKKANSFLKKLDNLSKRIEQHVMDITSSFEKVAEIVVSQKKLDKMKLQLKAQQRIVIEKHGEYQKYLETPFDIQESENKTEVEAHPLFFSVQYC